MSPLLALFVPLALAAPTPEEEALRAALEGRGAAVLRALEAGDADQRWLAGRWAIQGAPTQVPRLLPGPTPRERWGHIDLLAAQGAWGEAATRALGLMDRALAGEHRDALAEQLVGWARERAATDPSGAAGFLRAALSLGPKDRRAAEEAWFRLAAPEDAAAVLAARLRLREDPSCTPAALLVARSLARDTPSAAAPALARIVADGGRDDALLAAQTLSGTAVPLPWIEAALRQLGARFPRDLEVARLRLDHALGLLTRDVPSALRTLAELEQLGSGPPGPAEGAGPGAPADVDAALRELAASAARARAGATPDPTERRRLWLAIAAREGVGPRADEARAAALRALEAAVAAAPEGEARQAAATAALREPDAAGSAALRYFALPDGPGRLAALREFVTTWSGAGGAVHACAELADGLLAAGTDRAGAEAFAEDCGDVNPAAEVLRAHAGEQPRLHLQPRPGGLDVYAATAARLDVQQHRVDPEALFLGTAGHPLDARLDAFLLDPDLGWTVERPEGSLRTVELRPRGGGPLVALTVRAGDERATALVPAHLLEVQVVRDADDLVIAVLDGGVPVSGASLLVQPTTGDPRRLRTGADGLARIDDLADGVRIMARRGDGVGWALTGAGDAPSAGPEGWALVPWVPAVEAGGPVELSVLHTGRGAPPAELVVVSRAPTGVELERAPVRLREGAARVQVYAAPAGRLELQGDGVTLTHAALLGVAPPTPLDPAVRVWFEPSHPRAGEEFVTHVVPVGPRPPGGLAVELSVDDEAPRALVLGPKGVVLPLRRGAEEDVRVGVRLADGRVAGADVRVAPAAGWSAGLPGGIAPLLDQVPHHATREARVIMPGPAEAWWHLSAYDQERWVRGGEAFEVPSPGVWTACAWDGACVGEARLFVPDAATPLDAAGRWTGPPTLLAHTADGVVAARLVRTGEVLVPPSVPGAPRTPLGRAAPGAAPAAADGPGAPPHGWLVSADPEAQALPLRPPATPTPTVKATLVRAGDGVIQLAGLPEGSRVWAWLWDATSGELPADLAVAPPWSGSPGMSQLPWGASGVDGEAIAAALLAEEERLAEKEEPARLDYDFGADEETVGGASGYGMGGGGYGARGEGGFGRGGGNLGRAGRVVTAWADDPGALAVLDGAPVGPWKVALPGWVASVSLRMVARTPDGRWVSLREQLDVAGAEPVARTLPAVAPLPAAPDGAALLAAARRLDPDSRAHAAAALAAAGVPGARAELLEALSRASGGPGAALARALAGLDDGTRPERPALPDARRVERAETALATVLEDPERARAAAQRLLAEPSLEPWARARALLALWATGGDLAAAPVPTAELSGDDPGATSLGAAWSIVSDTSFADMRASGLGAAAEPAPAGRRTGHAPPTPELVRAWWELARADGALGADRALAIHALSLGLAPETGPSRRGAAAEGAPSSPAGDAARRASAGAGGLTLRVEAPYAEWRGQRFVRQSWIGVGYAVGAHPALDLRPGADGVYSLPRGAALPLWVTVPPSPLPGRVACPAGPGLVSETPWAELRPSPHSVAVECRVRVWDAEALTVTWYRPDGRVAGRIVAPVRLGEPRDAGLEDPLSDQERFALAVAQATSLAERAPDGGRLPPASPGGPSPAPGAPAPGAPAPGAPAPGAPAPGAPAPADPADPARPDALAERRRAAARALEAQLLHTPAPAAELRLASTTLLATWRDVGTPAELLAALRAYRERVPGGSLDLATAAAVARAYAAVGEPERALAAARVVLDARFREELGAVNSLQGDGLALTSLKLLRELLERYPEGPTVVTARYLAPTMLLARAEGDGDRLGYTRSSLRHTAAAELAGFLLVHPDAPEAPKAAVLLADALHALGDPARERALTGLLARRYRAAPEAWRLALAEGRAALAEGRAAEALRLFDGMRPPPEALGLVALERGRALDTLGRPAEARAAWAQSGLPEARDRAAWLDRAELELPELVVLGPDEPARLPATLAPGAEVTVTAIRVQLEAALLRDMGAIDPGALSVAGLAPTASRTVRAGADGDVPLPALPTGAYVLTVTVGGLAHHTVLVRSDAELQVRGQSGGSLVVLADRAGRPIPDAQLWLFDGGEVTTATTDPAGTAWVPTGGGRVGTLARAGDRYALANLGADTPPPPSRPPSPAPMYKESLDVNQRAYEQLFDQAASQEVNAKAL